LLLLLMEKKKKMFLLLVQDRSVLRRSFRPTDKLVVGPIISLAFLGAVAHPLAAFAVLEFIGPRRLFIAALIANLFVIIAVKIESRIRGRLNYKKVCNKCCDKESPWADKFKYCKGCQRMCYCSKKCQSLARPQTCLSIIRYFSTFFRSFSSHVWCFIRHLVKDVVVHMTSAQTDSVKKKIFKWNVIVIKMQNNFHGTL
jgi:hypothetical protein